jgi:glycosyltransferase involved in cell wall biosynthesis
MKKFFAGKSMIFHLILFSRGINFFPLSQRSNKDNTSKKVFRDKTSQKKILIVGMSESPHLHTWIEGIAASHTVSEIWLFPSDFPLKKYKNRDIKVHEFPYIFFGRLMNILYRVLDTLTSRLWRSYFLYREIKRIKPTHLHFHETQHGAYLYTAIARHPRNKFRGKLILSTWGSDLVVYGRAESHVYKVKEVMSWVDLLSSERFDDLEVAKLNGFTGEFLAPIYITIGNSNSEIQLTRTSERSMVLIKGYQDNHGRALNALASIESLAAEMDLSDFQFKIFSAADSVKLKSELLRSEHGIDIRVLPRMAKPKLMEYFGNARVYLGLAISDGLSTSMVEAMTYGAFPIQSNNSSAPEFLENEVTGGIVDPWDIAGISKLLQRALLDDELVNQAALVNFETLKEKYDWETGLTNLVRIYD